MTSFLAPSRGVVAAAAPRRAGARAVTAATTLAYWIIVTRVPNISLAVVITRELAW